MEEQKRVKNKDYVMPMRTIAPGVYRGGTLPQEDDSFVVALSDAAVKNLNSAVQSEDDAKTED
jgi:hypothetical protein